MVRKNEKKQIINYENCIKKSNELSMAKLNHGLTLNQMQLLAYAIYSTQLNNATEFSKADFEKKFNLVDYKTSHAIEDAEKLLLLTFKSIHDEEEFDGIRIFRRIKYKKGTFSFTWDDELVPHILELKEKYIITDITIASQFKSSFTWTLYDFLKAHYGYWHKPISKETLMSLFGVEDKKTYQKNTGDFKKTVLDIAIKEINSLTEFEVRYKEEKKGRAIVGFDLIWSNGSTVASATKKQIKELKAILDMIFEDVLKYVNLNDSKNRERAIELIRELEGYKEYIKEPICITKERAEFFIVKANSHLRELEQYLEEEKKTQLPFYNWLDN